MAIAETPRTTVADGPGNATIASGKRAVQITTSQVQPPTPLYLQTEDSLLLILSSPIQGSTTGLALILRWLRPDGEIVSIRKPIPNLGSGGQFAFTLGEGFLLSVTLAASAAAPTSPGATFATLVVQRDAPDTQIYSWVLFADYVTVTHFPSWPFGRNQFSQEGPGRIRSITGTTPGAGADINETVANNVRWRLIAFRATLTTSATVSNRIPRLTFDDGSNIFYSYGSSNPQAASTTISYNAIDGAPFQTDTSGAVTITLPCNIFLVGGYRIRYSTLNLQAADQWTAPQYLVQEWLEF